MRALGMHARGMLWWTMASLPRPAGAICTASASPTAGPVTAKKKGVTSAVMGRMICADEDNEEDSGERESDDLDGYDSERVNAIARKRRRY